MAVDVDVDLIGGSGNIWVWFVAFGFCDVRELRVEC